jgi:hypothetical protein
MPALEIRPEEVGVYDYAAYRSIKKRLLAPAAPARERLAATLYDEPIGPIRFRDWLHVSDKPIILGDEPKRITFQDIRSEILKKHSITFEQLVGRQRAKKFVLARRELWWRASKETKLSLPQMGRLTGDRDHTTVRDGIQSEEARRTGTLPPRILANRIRSRKRYEARRARAAAIAAE